MNNQIEEYLTLLKKELKGSDKATIQDALSDAREHIYTALEIVLEEQPDLEKENALQAIIEEYGTPEETASAYREIELRVKPTLAYERQTKDRSALSRFFGIYADPQAWGALFFMLFSLLTGMIYLVWTLYGATFSLTFTILLSIFWAPFTGLFILSIRGLGLIEGRIVEALLGVRMPRRPLYYPKAENWKERVKLLAKDKLTWYTLGYMLLMFPLGTIYFCLFLTLITASLAFMSTPILELVFGLPFIQTSGMVYHIPVGLLPFTFLFGLVLATASMHLAKWVGKGHGKLAKKILVAE